MARSALWFWWLGSGVLMLGACIQPDEELPPEAYYVRTDQGVSAADAGPAAAPSDAAARVPEAAVADPSGDRDGGLGADPEEQPPKQDCVAPLVEAMRAELDECRQCHSPRGAAKKSEFLLDGDESSYVAAVRAAYDAYGRDLLAVPAHEDGRRHSGGRWLNKGTASYAAWEALMNALANPEQPCNSVGN